MEPHFAGGDRMMVDDDDASVLTHPASRVPGTAGDVYVARGLDEMAGFEFVTPQNRELVSMMAIPAMAGGNLPPALHSSGIHTSPTTHMGYHTEQAPHPRAAPSTPVQRPVNLSEISRSPLNLPRDPIGFELSPSLQHDLSVGRACSSRRTRHAEEEIDRLVARVLEEVKAFAKKKKEMVRVAKKEIQTLYNDELDATQKSRLRSRREAEVTRVKNREEDFALRQALRWMIANTEIRHPENCPCRVNGGFTGDKDAV